MKQIQKKNGKTMKRLKINMQELVNLNLRNQTINKIIKSRYNKIDNKL